MTTTKYYPLRKGYNDLLGRYVPRDETKELQKRVTRTYDIIDTVNGRRDVHTTYILQLSFDPELFN